MACIYKDKKNRQMVASYKNIFETKNKKPTKSTEIKKKILI